MTYACCMDIEHISIALTEYHDGDLLGLSDIIDEMAVLRKQLSFHPLAIILSRGLYGHLQDCFRTGSLLRRDFLAETLDRLRFLIKQTPETLITLKPDLQAIAREWRQRYVDLLPEATLNPTAKSTGTQIADPVEAPISAPSGLPLPKPSLNASANPFAQEETFKIFLLDAQERLANAQALCINLEQNPNDDQTCQELFRIFHTFKGECGFFKLATLGELAHSYENLLDLVRRHEVEVDSALVDLLLRGIDRFQILINALSNQDVVLHNNIELDDLERDIDAIRLKVHQPIGDKLVAAGAITEIDKMTILQRQKDTVYDKFFGEVAIEKKLTTADEIEQALKQPSSKTKSSIEAKFPQTFGNNDQYIKVQANQINYLVDMVGELIIAQNQLDSKDPAIQPLRKITKEIQAAALKLRTTKLKAVSFRVQRALRDLAQQLAKPIQFESRGDDLEIDRNLVEGLTEPLLHMIRNAVHHGIETAEQRQAKGKALEGRVILEAKRLGNSIVISIEDDGKGLSRSAILAKAIALGMVSKERESSITDHEVWDLIFRPGFSTADSVDQISGRGVGMDIVNSFVQANRGRIEIQTEADAFTRINLYFPISTAIIDGMITGVADLTLILPVSQVIESLNFQQFETFQVNGKIDVVNLRGTILPIIDLGIFFDRGPCQNKQCIGVVIENSVRKRFIFLVDRLIGKREVVIKSLGSRFKDLKAINSGTVLAGGLIGYIIDTEHIIQASGIQIEAEGE